MPLVELDKAALRLGRATVLADIDWRLDPHQHWAVVGGNGAGKTSLLKLIAGEYWPNDGQRVYDFGDGPETDAVAALREIQIVSHELEERYEKFAWNFQATVVVLTGIWDMTIPRRKATAKEFGWALTCLRRMGAIALAHRPFLSLSRGERRRVLLARALASRPKVLLLDEAMAGLDQPHRQRLSKHLAGVSRHTSIILSQHHRRQLPDWVTHVLELEAGRIVDKGPVGRGTPAPGRQRRDRRTRNTAKTTELVRVEAADVWLDDRRVLSGLSWTLLTGQNWLVTGPNGAGKSTLLRLLHGQLRPARGGSIHWRGHDAQDGIEGLRKLVAWVAPALETDYRYPDSVRETVASGFASSIGLVRRPTRQQWRRVDEVLDTLELTALAERPLASLSYGQRRRVMIARALVNQPMLLLLDEPTEGMDDVTRDRFEALLRRLVQRESCQLVCASHLEWGHTLFTHRLSLTKSGVKSEMYS